jgi:quercetin dioxygenase-like cupin family protein
VALVRNYKDVAPVKTPYADKRVVIGPKQGAPNFVMRVIDMAPGASYSHSHDWEHEVFVLSGEATLVTDEAETQLKPDDLIYIAPFEKHGLANRSQEIFRFI